MHCELCGKEIRRGYLIRIEGATLIACEDCAERGEIIRPVTERTSRREQVAPETVVEKDLVPVEHYGMVVRKAREQRGMKIEDVAHRLGIPESTLRKIEEEKLVPPLDVARKLERFFNIQLYEEICVEYEETAERDEKPALTLGDVIKLRWKK